MSKEQKLAQVFHFDLFGKRELKYDFLNEQNLATIQWKTLNPQAPELFLVPKDFETKATYDKGFAVNELFILNNVGIVTARDGFVTSDNRENLIERIKNFFIMSREEILSRYDIKENNVWKINEVKQKIKIFELKKIAIISYRPFDFKYIYYDNNFIERSRAEVMQHFIKGDNIGLVFKLGNAEENSVSAMVSKSIIDFRSWSRPGMQGGDYIAPLYMFPETNGQQTIDQSNVRKPNLNTEIVNQIATKLGLTFTTEKETTIGTFAPIDILDYIYAVLHSPTYREKYKEFLKIDFPRVPYPKEMTSFKKMSSLGSQLREMNLLESPIVSTYITQYPIDGNNVVTKPHFIFLESSNPNPTHGRVYINDSQYFSGVPEVAWKFYIGGYQPAQKWLKDRKERTLEFDDILHYQKIIVALTETDRLMKEIDTLNLSNF